MDESPVQVPALGTHAKSKLWLRATFGRRADQFGKFKMEDGTYPPQGFVPRVDGRLLVLDTGKQRLVWFGRDGKVERTVPLPVGISLPSDVAVARDGTIAVLTDSGVMHLFDAQGTPKQESNLRGESGLLYAVGDDFFVNTDGLTSFKVGDTKGSRNPDTPGLHREQDDSIVGDVAPDGTTVLSADLDGRANFRVSAVRGAEGRHVWKRSYELPGVTGIPFLQADAAGRVYAVVNWPGAVALVCIDGKTGDPVGAVQLPYVFSEGGTIRREFSVVPSGGLVYARATQHDMRYEWLDCHP